MATAPGQEPGHGSGHGFSWREYVDGLAQAHGSLAAVAQRLARNRAWSDDVASIERALRRLRGRGQLAGGLWGERALATFGLPSAADARVRWMGMYHSRFTDLPVPLCLDLIRLWDQPPVSEAPAAATWLALAHASCMLRSGNLAETAPHLRRARAGLAHAPVEARIETLLVESFVQSRTDESKANALLVEAGRLFDEKMPADDRACLYARWIDQQAWTHNKAGHHAKAERLYLALPSEGVPPFALYRRASGLAYARWKQGKRAEAATLANEAAQHAGDGGHLRLRAMSLSMQARILGRTAEAAAARARALSIVAALDDEALRARLRG